MNKWGLIRRTACRKPPLYRKEHKSTTGVHKTLSETNHKTLGTISFRQTKPPWRCSASCLAQTTLNIAAKTNTGVEMSRFGLIFQGQQLLTFVSKYYRSENEPFVWRLKLRSEDMTIFWSDPATVELQNINKATQIVKSKSRVQSKFFIDSRPSVTKWVLLHLTVKCTNRQEMWVFWSAVLFTSCIQLL